GQRRGGAVGTDLVQAHALEHVCHRVSHLGGRCQGEVDDAEGNTEALGGHRADQLACAGDLEGSLLDLLGNLVEGGTSHRGDRVVDHTGARDADGDHRVQLLDAVEGTSHERVITDRVGEDYELRTGDGGLVLRQLGCFFDDPAHQADGVHVHAGTGGRNVHRAADRAGGGQCLGDGADEPLVRGRRALLDERGVATDEVHAELAGGTVQSLGDLHRVTLHAGGDEGDGGDGDTLVHNRDPELALDALTHGHQVAGALGHAIVDRLRRGLHGGAGAANERDAHRDRADIQAVVLDHPDDLEEAGRREFEVHAAPP